MKSLQTTAAKRTPHLPNYFLNKNLQPLWSSQIQLLNWTKNIFRKMYAPSDRIINNCSYTIGETRTVQFRNQSNYLVIIFIWALCYARQNEHLQMNDTQLLCALFNRQQDHRASAPIAPPQIRTTVNPFYILIIHTYSHTRTHSRVMRAI